ncbi:MAG: PepSY domain-containing protein [Pyrinomonadaceae bacterium]
MKRSTIFVFCFVLVFSIFGVAGSYAANKGTSAKSTKITVEEARKIALKKVAGTIEDEFTLEDDEGAVDTFVFVIKSKDEKIFEVQIGAEKGEVISVEEYVDEGDETPPRK